jgi:hypothetical protein
MTHLPRQHVGSNRRARLVPISLLLVVAVLAAGCGSKSSQPETTAEWADSACTAVTTWKDSIKTAIDPITSGDISKDSLQSAADNVKSSTDTLESDLKDLGKPDTAAGQQAKDLVDQLSSNLSTDVDTIKTAVGDVSGLSSIAGAVTTVTTTLATMQTQVSSAYTSLTQLDPGGELESAFQQSSSCQQLKSAG